MLDLSNLVEATVDAEAHKMFFQELAKHGYWVKGLSAGLPNGTFISVTPGKTKDVWGYSPYGGRGYIFKETAPTLSDFIFNGYDDVISDLAFDVATTLEELTDVITHWGANPERLQRGIVSRLRAKMNTEAGTVIGKECEWKITEVESSDDEIMPFYLEASDKKCLAFFAGVLRKTLLDKSDPGKVKLFDSGVATKNPDAAGLFRQIFYVNLDALAVVATYPMKTVDESGNLSAITGDELVRRYRVAVTKAVRATL